MDEHGRLASAAVGVADVAPKLVPLKVTVASLLSELVGALGCASCVIAGVSKLKTDAMQPVWRVSVRYAAWL